MLRFVNQQAQGVEDNDQRAAFVKCNCWSDIETDGQQQMGEFVGYQGNVATGRSPIKKAAPDPTRASRMIGREPRRRR